MNAVSWKRARAPWQLCASWLLCVLVVPSGPQGFSHAHDTSRQRGSASAAYSIPAVTLVDQKNQPIQFDTLLAQSRPTLVEFFFTTCTTFCDVRSAQLVAVQHELAEAHIEMAFVSISLDPEFDRPERLQAYATHIQPAPDNWWLLTGPVPAIEEVVAAFDARNPSADKMLHQPLTFIRANPSQPWVRLEGMMSAHELAGHVKAAVARSSP